MRTTVELDEKLMQLALDLSQLRTKKEVIHLALEQLVRRLQRLQFAKLRGSVLWEGDLDEMRKL